MTSLPINSERHGCADTLWLAFFIAISMAAFWPTREAGFVTDWLGWQAKYEVGGWSDALQSIGYKALHPVLHCFNYLIFKLFGINHLVWFGIFAGLHGLNGWLIYLLVRRLLTLGGGLAPVFPPLAAALLFVLCPYNAEPLVWRACVHYLLTGFFLLMALHKTLDFREEGKFRDAGWAIFWVALGLFTFEWSVAMPVLMLVVFIFAGDKERPFKQIWKLAMPLSALVILWFFLNKHFLGVWVGHYGENTHFNLDPKMLASTALKYFIKYAFFARYWEHPTKSAVFDNLEKTEWILVGMAFFALLFGLFLWKQKTWNPRMKWGFVALACFFVAVLPVSNLYFYYFDWSENDRYGYFASIFISIAIALIPSGLRWGYPLAVAVWLGASVLNLQKTTAAWHDGAAYTKNLLDDFRWFDKEEVILLASPDNFKGTYMNRIIGRESGFQENLALIRRTPFPGRMIEAVQFNLQNPLDGIKAEADSSGLQVKIAFMQDGNWFMRNGIGAANYENDRFKFEKREWDALLTLKERRANSVLIYPVAGRWMEIK